jgi:hypothetical protein
METPVIPKLLRPQSPVHGDEEALESPVLLHHRSDPLLLQPVKSKTIP